MSKYYIYGEVDDESLYNLMDVLYGCQRGVHNWEQWGDYEEYEKMGEAFNKVDDTIKELELKVSMLEREVKFLKGKYDRLEEVLPHDYYTLEGGL